MARAGRSGIESNSVSIFFSANFTKKSCTLNRVHCGRFRRPRCHGRGCKCRQDPEDEFCCCREDSSTKSFQRRAGEATSPLTETLPRHARKDCAASSRRFQGKSPQCRHFQSRRSGCAPGIFPLCCAHEFDGLVPEHSGAKHIRHVRSGQSQLQRAKGAHNHTWGMIR